MKTIDHTHNTLNKKKRVVYPLLFVLFSAIILFNIYHIVSRGKYQVEVFQVQHGWGFEIKHHDKTFISQPFIPARPGKTAFPTKESARATGKLMAKRLNRNILPLITPDDLFKLGVDTISVKRSY